MILVYMAKDGESMGRVDSDKASGKVWRFWVWEIGTGVLAIQAMVYEDMDTRLFALVASMALLGLASTELKHIARMGKAIPAGRRSTDEDAR